MKKEFKKMEILLYIMIGLFVLDIILGLIFSHIEGKREALLDYKLSCLIQGLEYKMSDDIFPEFKDGEANGFDSGRNN